MCGIAGSVSVQGTPPREETVRRMVALLPHRGPDETGVVIVGPAGLGHARLSIIDLAGGKQPMALAGGDLTLTFNGEIFNYLELRDELVRDHGRVFQTSSDTEVILHAYAVWGERAVERFNGQWAFAIWDARRKRLFASRDRLGIRPFFHARTADAFLFASEVKALYAVPGLPRAIDPVGIDQILTFWSTVPPRTAFEGVSELPAGHNLTLDLSVPGGGDVHIAPYWALDYAPDDARSEESFAEELRATLIDAVRLRLRADVPVAAYLSGGIDSTVITSLIKKFTDTPLRTFSVTFEDASYDESAFQEQVVRELGITEHSTIRATTTDIGQNFPAAVWHMEQPVIRTAPVPMYLLSGLVRRSGYKVVLTGEGADEMLGGYDIFKEAKVRRFIARQPGSTSRPKLLRKLYPYMPNLQAQSDEYLKAFFYARPADLESPFFSHMPRWEMTSKIKGLYAPAMRERLAGTDAYRSLRETLPARYASWDPFSQAQYLESTMLMGGYLLSSQGDRVGMGNSIEGRFPFLDVRVAELAMKIPPTSKMKVLREKHILKRAMADLIPDFLQKRPKQPYRAVDVTAFFDLETKRARFPWVDELLSASAIERGGLFHPAAVGKLVDKARAGQIIGVKDGMALVAVLSSQLVHAQFIQGEDLRPPT